MRSVCFWIARALNSAPSSRVSPSSVFSLARSSARRAALFMVSPGVVRGFILRCAMG